MDVSIFANGQLTNPNRLNRFVPLSSFIMPEAPHESRQDDIADTDPFGETVAVDAVKDPWDRFVNLRAVARAQRHLLYWVLLIIAWYAVGAPLVGRSIGPIPFLLEQYIFFGATLVTAVLVGRLNWAMGQNAFMTFFAVVFTLIPIMNVINILFSSWAANSRLKDARVATGLFGASDEAVTLATSPWCCLNCGYDLTANVSGRCPECGRPLSEEARSAIARRAADIEKNCGARRPPHT